MSNAMEAEFGTMSTWTADVAETFGANYRFPAACRGSGGPRTLDLLLDGLDLTVGTPFLDVGSGMGGPSAYVRTHGGVRPIPVEPEFAACRAAQRLFGLPVTAGDAYRLPFPDATFPAAWSVGVLCTIGDHRAMLAELARVTTPQARIALLVYVAQDALPDEPEGNNFPTETSLREAADAAGLHIVHEQSMVRRDDEDPDWLRHAVEVEDAVADGHRHDEAWQTAESQSARMGRLIGTGHVAGRVLHLART